MTVINGIEIDCIHYETNPIRDAIESMLIYKTIYTHE